MPTVPHYLIVDRPDRAAFSHLVGQKRRLIESESILGNWTFRMPGRKSLWLTPRALPVRGWIIQQILKIGAIDVIPERTLVFCDSDTAFFRHFDRGDLMVDGKIGLLDVDFSTDESRRWTTTSRKLLGVTPLNGNYRTYVGNMICWNRETVKAMRQQIETITGSSWQIALLRKPGFSEYMIYGTFVREVVGYDRVDHAPSAVPLVKASWGTALSTDSAIEEFFSEFDQRTVAVMIHSKAGVDVSRYRHFLEHHWNSSGK
jgi:hypothetical protein